MDTDVDRLLEELSSARSAVVPCAGVDEIKSRGRRKAVQRRGRIAATSTLALLAVLGLGFAMSDTYGDSDGSADLSMSNPTEPAHAVIDSVVVSPSTGLTDGQVVQVAISPDSGGELTVHQCSNPEVEHMAEVDLPNYCDRTVHHLRGATNPAATFPVSRILQTESGVVDCANYGQVCGLLVNGVWSEVEFHTPVEPVPPPSVTVHSPMPVLDGQRISFSVDGFAPNEEIYMGLCAVPTGSERICDSARTARYVADAGGSATGEFAVYAAVFGPNGWEQCDPCALSVSSARVPDLSTDLAMTLPATPILPTIEIVSSAPETQEVDLVGHGFQPLAANVMLGVCTQNQPGSYRCSYPPEGSGTVVDENGELAISGFPTADPCLVERMCQIGWTPIDGGPLAISVDDAP